MTGPRARLRLATLSDLGRIYSDAEWLTLDLRTDVHSGLPPPGTVLEKNPLEQEHDEGAGFPYIAGEIQGEIDGLAVGDLYWTTLGQYAVGLSSAAVTQLVARVTLLIAGLPGTWATPLTYPIVYEVGSGSTMRWLSSTIRGTLAPVEQFQFKIDWGNPGSDPDIDEEAALAFAEVISIAAAAFMDYAAMGPFFAPSVKITEVGVTTKTQTDPTGSDGTGGNLAQSYPTQWFGFPVGSEPVGSSTAVSLPYEVACAVTLQTDTRGPRGRGRFYLPPFATGGMTANGLYGDGICSAIGNGVKTMLNTIATTSGYVPLVVSRRAIQLHEVTSVLVGHVPDSQRRRRRSQVEARVQAIL